MKGDKYIVNCCSPHPYLPIIATSGIDDSIKIWETSDELSQEMINKDKIIEKNKKGDETNLRRILDHLVIMEDGSLRIPATRQFLNNLQFGNSLEDQEDEEGEEEEEEEGRIRCQTN
jgi:DDB1- and CUL4-associated factor 8